MSCCGGLQAGRAPLSVAVLHELDRVLRGRVQGFGLPGATLSPQPLEVCAALSEHETHGVVPVSALKLLAMLVLCLPSSSQLTPILFAWK